MKYVKNKMGFTLLELIGVIVILAVIALIAVPLVFGYIKTSKEKSFLESVRNLEKTVELKYQMKTLDEETTHTITNGTISPKLDISGQIDGKGFVTMNQNHQIRLAVQSGELCAQKSYTDMTVSLLKGNCPITPGELVNLDTTGAIVPKLDSSMVAIRYSDGKWIKADKENANKEYQWYDYKSGMWANSVVLRSNKVAKYKEAPLGTEIEEDDVIAYLVGIPSFSYKLSEGMGEREFLIDFTSSTENGFNAHPAFHFKDKEVQGFWFGKYEVSGTTESIRVIPNKPTLKSVSLGTMYEAVNEVNLMKKIDMNNRNIADIHLTKSSEWGAVTILTQSVYGRCKNSICTQVSKNQVWNTGYAKKDQSYETKEGMDTSTTGTIYGIYDMNGCAWEFVMGTNKVTSLNVNVKIPEERYDNYKDVGILGDLTTEDGTMGWYGANAKFVTASQNWLVRGGDVNTANSSIFWYQADGTAGGFRNGFRISYVLD